MEAVRPGVDTYVLELLQRRTFKAADFYESPRGICRLLPPTTWLLAETAPTWAQLVAPVAEQVVQALAQGPGSRIQKLSTPLTNSKRRARQVRHRAPEPATPRTPKPRATCRRWVGNFPIRDASTATTACPALVRRGERVPHSRHWQAILNAGKASED